MKKNLTETELAALIPNIKRVLETGQPWEDKTLHHPVGAIIDAVTTIAGISKDGVFDTNGWQYDWWQNFIYAGKTYTLSGSGYYGGHKFHLADE